MTALWSNLGGKAMDRFGDLLLSPALAFWFGGLLAWIYSRGWQALIDAYHSGLENADPVAQVAVAIGALLVIAGSAKVVQRLTLPTLRLLEGYWPGWAARLTHWAIARRGRRTDALAGRWRELYMSRPGHTPEQAREFGRLNVRRAGVPADPADRMPTAFGDLLKAMETRPRHRYGLDAVVCFPRLWLVMPDAARANVAGARAQVDDAGRLWLWSLLFAAWTPLAWWAAVISVVGMLVAYRFALLTAAEFAQLVVSCFDLYRGDLYDHVGESRPASLAAEPASGTALTAWFERGRPPS
jgi:hypothetical protein